MIMESFMASLGVQMFRRILAASDTATVLKNDADALLRVLYIELNHVRDMVRVISRLPDSRSMCKAVGKTLSVPVLESIVSNSGAHAKALERLGALSIKLESEDETGSNSLVLAVGDISRRIVISVRNLAAIGQISAALNEEESLDRIRLGVRLKNLEELLYQATTALSKTLH
jgi:hypothetical protein